NAVNSHSTSYSSVCLLLNAAHKGILYLGVSLHTLRELEEKKDEAWKLASSLPEIPHWSIGTWKQQSGTWDDGRKNDKIQKELETLAKSGNDIRDRGAFIDVLCSGYDGFVTSDKELAGKGPAKRISDRFSIKVLSPEQLVNELGLQQGAPENKDNGADV
ncbi:hypothetical protein JYT87_03555, partial [Nitrospira defluvii]|nr:hypothetical protein [Nitrospira defluvii]